MTDTIANLSETETIYFTLTADGEEVKEIQEEMDYARYADQDFVDGVQTGWLINARRREQVMANRARRIGRKYIEDQGLVILEDHQMLPLSGVQEGIESINELLEYCAENAADQVTEIEVRSVGDYNALCVKEEVMDEILSKHPEWV